VREHRGVPLVPARRVRERARGRQHPRRREALGGGSVSRVGQSVALANGVTRQTRRVADDQERPPVLAQLQAFDDRRVRDFARLDDVQGFRLHDGDDAAAIGDEDVVAGFAERGVPGRSRRGGVDADARDAAHEARLLDAAGHLGQRGALATAGEGEERGAVVGGADEREGGIVRGEVHRVRGRVQRRAEEGVALGDVPDGDGAVRGGGEDLAAVARPRKGEDRARGVRVGVVERAVVHELARDGARLEIPNLDRTRRRARGEKGAAAVERQARRLALLQRLLDDLHEAPVPGGA
jgi:hypothetical protein